MRVLFWKETLGLIGIVLGGPFVKRFALCYRTGVCPVLSVTLVYCGQTVGRIKMKLGMQVGLSPGHTVLDGDPGPPPPKGTALQFLAHMYCAQTAGWIKMPVGVEVGLYASDIVLDGDPASTSRKRGQSPPPPIFGPCLLWPNGCVDQDVTWYGGRSRHRPHCAGWGPSSSPQKGAQPPNFWPMSIVPKRVDGSRCHWLLR